MARAAFGEMSDGPRRWMRRLGTVSSLMLFVYALYRAAVGEQQGCNFPKNPKPGIGYACDVSPPTHPHTLFWLIFAAVAVTALFAVRRLLAEDG